MVPDFEADAAAIAEYESALRREERVTLAEAEREVRATYHRKRPQLLSEVAASSVALEECRKRSESAVHAYGQRYPDHVHGSQLQRPGFFEALFSFGGASRLYNAAARTVDDTLKAQAAYRRHQRAEQDLEEWLARSLTRAAAEVREKMHGSEFLDKFHAQPDVEPLWKRVQAIREERAAYEQRLAAGEVPPLEQRARFMGENRLLPLRAPSEKVVLESIVTFGDISCWIFVDGAGTKFVLPYDRRLESLIEWAFDTYVMADRIEVKFTRLEDGRRLSALDQYVSRMDDESDARSEWRNRNAMLRVQMDAVGDAFVDDAADKRLLDLLAALVTAVV
ncbi:MAG: hypothetical protein ACRENA_14425 [Vulcanimicrobiaceae bacterium]